MPDQLSPVPLGSIPDQPPTIEALSAFGELSRIKLDDGDIDFVLSRVAELAKRWIPGAAEVSVTLITNGVAGTAAYTGALALNLDEKQYDSGRGPCLDAALTQHVNIIDDMILETRWPAFTKSAAEHGARASLSVGIPVRQAVAAALNIYALQTSAFDEEAVSLGRAFASQCAVALANAHLYATTAALADHMRAAMVNRAVIEQAKGILIAEQRVTPDEAFDILSRASQVSNRKLRDIAQGMVDAAQAGGGNAFR